MEKQIMKTTSAINLHIPLIIVLALIATLVGLWPMEGTSCPLMILAAWGLADLDYLVATDLLGRTTATAWTICSYMAPACANTAPRSPHLWPGRAVMDWICANNQGLSLGMILARYRDLEHDPDCENHSYLPGVSYAAYH